MDEREEVIDDPGAATERVLAIPFHAAETDEELPHGSTFTLSFLGGMFSLVGAAVSAHLLLTHVSSGGSGCTGGVADCSQVILTKYGYVAGLPIPMLLVPYYMLLAGGFALVGVPGYPGRNLIGKTLTALTAFAMLPSVALFVLSAKHGNFCRGCLTLDGLNIALLIIAVLVGRRLPTLMDASNHRGLYLVGGSAAMLFCTMLFGWTSATARVGELRDSIKFDSGLRVKGHVGVESAHQLHIELDPICGHCAQSWPQLLPALDHPELNDTELTVGLYAKDVGCLVDLEVLLPAGTAPDTGGPQYREPRTGEVLRAVEGKAERCRTSAWAFCAYQQGKLRQFLDAIYGEIRDRGDFSIGKFRTLAHVAKRAGLDNRAQLHCTGDSVQTGFSLDRMDPTARAAFAEHLTGQGEAFGAASFGTPALFVHRDNGFYKEVPFNEHMSQKDVQRHVLEALGLREPSEDGDG